MASTMQMLERAVEVAKRGQKRDFRLGAMARRKDGALVSSCNSRTQFPSHPAHAEYRCLQKAGKGSIMWIARVNNDGRWAMAKPCGKCQALIRAMAVKKVYYTVGPNEWGTWVPGEPLADHKKHLDSTGRAYWREEK